MATLEYWRADNMWADRGRPDGELGKESVTVVAGQPRVFVTDWRYEKKRNDGTNYYGSHARRIRNASQDESIVVRLTGGPLLDVSLAMVQVMNGGTSNPEVKLHPGQQLDLKHDIIEVRALAPQPRATKDPGATPPTVKPAPLPQPGIGRAGRGKSRDLR